MSEKEKIKWEEFKKKLEEKGYLDAERGGLFFKFSLKSLSFIGSILRLSFLFSILSSFIISLLITIAISFIYKKAIPPLFIFYFLIFFILFFGIIPITNLIIRVKPIKNPSLFSFYSSLILSIFCSFLILINFGNFIQKSLRFSSFFIGIAIFFLTFFPLFKVLSLLTWKEIPLKIFKKIYISTFLILVIFSLLGLILFSKKSRQERTKNIPIPHNFEKIAFIGVDCFPNSENLFEEISLKKIIDSSMVFKLKIKEYKNPPIFWTEISTGFPSNINGFLSLKTYKLPLIKENLYPLPLSFFFEKLGIAKETIKTSGVRKKRTFWEISSLYYRYSLSLNWWASWEPIEPSGELISNLYFIKLLKGEKGNEYKLVEPPDLSSEELPIGYKWNKYVFEVLNKKLKDQALITVYFPGLDVQIEDMKNKTPDILLENSKYIYDNFKIIKDTIEILIEKNYKIIFVSYSGRNKEFWGWGFIYPNLKKLKLEKEVSIYSITPTILKILNLPISLKFQEKPISIPFDLFEEFYIDDYPPFEKKISTFSHPPLEELKSLGYLQ